MESSVISLNEETEKARAKAEEIIRKYLPEESIVPGRIVSAMNYSVLAGGKRVRPILILKSYELYGGTDMSLAGPFAAAIEMIHTSSLVHDDLPAIDNDEYRRGRKTTHAVYGPAIGVLAGDTLMNYAYETVMHAYSSAALPDSDVPADAERDRRVIRALQILLAKTGISGMLGGQSLDVENEKNGVLSVTKETLDYIYLHKTAALLEAPLMIGAVLGGAPEGDVKLLEQAGRKAGLAFQIRDDVLDVTKTTEEIGKPAGSDEANGKTTYVTLMGTEGAAKEAERLTGEALGLIGRLPGNTDFLREYLGALARREH